MYPNTLECSPSSYITNPVERMARQNFDLIWIQDFMVEMGQKHAFLCRCQGPTTVLVLECLVKSGYLKI